MDRADPRASQHGVGGLGDHRQIDGDPVAFLDALVFQHIGEAADIFMELAIGDVSRFRVRVVRLPDDGCLLAALLQMAVGAIGGDVERAVFEPFDRDVGILEAGVLDALIGFDPV